MSVKALPKIPALDVAPDGVKVLHFHGTEQIAARYQTLRVSVPVANGPAIIVDKQHGHYEAWHHTGRTAILGQNMRGDRHGLWQFFREDGTKDREELWIEGKRQ